MALGHKFIFLHIVSQEVFTANDRDYDMKQKAQRLHLWKI